MGGICVLIDKAADRAVDEAAMRSMVSPALDGSAGTMAVECWKHVGVAAYDSLGGDMRRCLHSDERLLVVCDAELYNHRDLPEGNPEGAFSEAAFIASLYRKHGKDWWRRTNGVYGAFIWDKREGKGWAFRDRIGVKPIVHWEDGRHIAVASRIKSISSRPGFPREIDPQAIFSYLNMEMIPTPFTIYSGIRKLESGFLLNVSGGGTKTEMGWNMSFPEDKISGQEEMKERIYHGLKEAVRRQVGYREPLGEVGAFLSGGTDSSSIAGLLNEIHPGRAQTFSMGFDEAGFDEMHYCHVAAKAFGTRHSEYYVTPADILAGLPAIVAAYDEPFANSSAIPSYYCAKMARERGVRVMLGGDGGDEIFGGNSRYRDLFVHFRRFPSWLEKGVMGPALAMLPRFAKVGPIRHADRYMRRARASLPEKIYAYTLPYYLDLEEIFERDFLRGRVFTTPADISRRYFSQSDARDDLDRFLYNDIKITLADNDLPKINRMTELAGIRVRYPFLDIDLVELTGRIPVEMKVKGDRLRHIFKEAMAGLLPDEIINKKKHGFGIPVARWMLRPGKLNDLVKDVIFDGRTAKRGFFRKSFLERLYRLSTEDKTTYFGTYLYYVFFLEMWMRQHADA